MTRHRTIQLCLVAALLMVVIMVWFTQTSRSVSRGTPVRMSSSEVRLFLGRNSIEIGGYGPLDVRKALTNRAHLETQARLLTGQKLYTLKTPNASLGQFVIALSRYANKPVQVLGEPREAWEWTTNRFGPFDSTIYLTRFGAARAIEERLSMEGWHVLRLTNGKLMFVTDADLKHLVDGSPVVELPPPPPTRTTPSPEGGASGAVPVNIYE